MLLNAGHWYAPALTPTGPGFGQLLSRVTDVQNLAQPGGSARLSLAGAAGCEGGQWGPMMERYLSGRESLKGWLLILDVHRFMDEDLAGLAWLRHHRRRSVSYPDQVR